MNLSGNELCGINPRGQGVYNADGIKAIADSIAVTPSVTSVRAFGNVVGVVGIDEVSAHCSLPVVQVNLANNQLCGINHLGWGTYNAGGIKAIAKAISVTASITSIDLSANQFGPECAKALAPAIRDSSSLTSIDLHLTCMGDEGKVLLRKAIEGRLGFKLLL